MPKSLPVFKIDKDYVTKLDELPTPADKAAALEAILTGELAEDDPSFIYRQLGERLQRIKERKDAGDEATAEAPAGAGRNRSRGGDDQDRSRNASICMQPGEYGLFTILRAHAPTADESYLADCARRMVAHLRRTSCSRRAGATRSAGECVSSSRCWPSRGIPHTPRSASIGMQTTRRS